MEIDTPSVTLGGKQWPVPKLAVKQNKIIDPLILGFLPVFAEWTSDRASALSKIDGPKYNDLLNIAYVAIRKASDIKRDDFEELPITLPELIAAFGIIAQQTGIFQRAEPGEAPGVGNPPTGTQSQPT